MFPLESFDSARHRILDALIGVPDGGQAGHSALESKFVIINALDSAWREFAEVLASGPAPAAVGEAHWIIQESHSGQRRPIFVDSAAAKRIYKPRSLSADAAWSSLISWMGTHMGDQLSIPLEIEDRTSRGWVGLVEHAPCSEADVVRYYERLGALAAIIWCLGGTDATGSNFVAARSYPTLVDAEMVLTPGNSVFSHSVAVEFRRGAIAPFLALDTHGIEVSYGAAALEGLPCCHRAMIDGTTTPCPFCHHVPFTDSRRHMIDGNEDALVRGFASGLTLISDLRSPLLRPSSPLSAFEQSIGRVVFRPSGAYSLVQKWYFGNLRSTGSPPDVASLLSRMPLKHALALTSRRELIRHESADIRLGDIPRFEISMAARGVPSLGTPAQFAFSGLERARKRIAVIDRPTASRVAGAWADYLKSMREAGFGITPQMQGKMNCRSRAAQALRSLATANSSSRSPTSGIRPA